MASSDHLNSNQIPKVIFDEKKDNLLTNDPKNKFDTYVMDSDLLSDSNIINNDSKKKKKKKKKISYQNLINSIKESKKTETEKEIEYQNKMRSVLGGGQFQKIDHI